ncbi:MAG: DUF2268 domain-containing putative Zn-dependent protease [Chloroflexota bacterium]
MKIQWIATNEIYHAIINAQTLSEKQALYRQKIMQPWQQMMQMMSGQAINPNDEFASARAWAWHTPDELDHIPQALTQLEAADAWQLGENALKKGVAAFADYDLPFDTVEGWLMLGVPERNPSHENYTGAIDFTHPRFVCQYFEPDERNIKALSGAVVHEFNHLVRLRVQPWDMMTTTVGDYIIHEGIAESFATALFGEDVLGYYVTDINDADLAIAKQLISENLQTTGFNVIRGYIFGDHLAEQWGFEKIGMPNFGGYAVGYHVVQAFLKKTGMSIQEATFLPAEQIIAESGYFD